MAPLWWRDDAPADLRVAALHDGKSLAVRLSWRDGAASRGSMRPEDFEGRMVISSDPDVHRAAIQKFVDLGFDRVYLHNVGRNQAEWIEVFGSQVLPKLTR